MERRQHEILEHLESLVEAGRKFWEGKPNSEDHFETELVRAEDFLAKEKE